MALTKERSRKVASRAVVLAARLAADLAAIHDFLEYNSDQAIDWGAGSTPAYIEESADGNMTDFDFTRQDVSNVIGSLDWIRKLLTNQAMTGSQGDHLGNLNKLSGPRTT